MAKKNTPTNTPDPTVDEFHKAMTEKAPAFDQIDVVAEMEDMERQLNHLIQQNLSLDNKLATEHKLRMHERNAAEGTELSLRRRLQNTEERLQKACLAKEQRQKKRLESIPVLATASLIALAMLAVPNVLHQFNIIGQQISSAIQNALGMFVACCMALIWDRAGK